MDQVAIIEQIQRNRQLLSLPQALSEILRELDKDNFSAQSLAQIILKDPSLTGRVLRMANSPYYYRLGETTNIIQAISVLGVTTVKCLALSSSIFDPAKISEKSGVDAKAFFSSTLTVAAASEKIAQTIKYGAPEEAFIAGLLHDIGVLFFLHHYPREYRRIIDKNVKAKTLVEAEIEMFDIDHCEVGARLANVWRLPEYIAKSAAAHHRVHELDRNDTLSNIVRLAVLLSKESFSGYDMGFEERMMYIVKLAEVLSLSREQIDEVTCTLLSASLEIANYLGVDIGNIEQILVKANQEIWKSYLTIEHLFKERQELNKKLLQEERTKGAIESKNIALSTLSHYLNNAVMGIYSRTQLMRMLTEKQKTEQLLDQLPTNLDLIERSVLKIVAVLQEMKEISPIDRPTFNDMSSILNIDDRIEQRLQRMLREREETTRSLDPSLQRS
jgi:putative nucleotidyltransferase with HDIG domain